MRENKVSLLLMICNLSSLVEIILDYIKKNFQYLSIFESTHSSSLTCVITWQSYFYFYFSWIIIDQ